ncbi:hypothetical protein LINGRAHAP2_LOCUS21165 [Linum grandiflorum]
MTVPSLSSIFRGGHRPANNEASQNQLTRPQPPSPPSNYVCDGDVCYIKRDDVEGNNQSKKSNKEKHKNTVACFSMFPRRIRHRKAPTM